MSLWPLPSLNLNDSNLKEQQNEILEWSSQSLDENLIEMLWYYPGQAIQAKEKTNKESRLKQQVYVFS